MFFEALGLAPAPNDLQESDVGSAPAPVPQSDVGKPVHSGELKQLVGDAAVRARTSDRGASTGTEHLLAAILDQPSNITDALVQAGLDLESLVSRLAETIEPDDQPIPLPADMPTLEFVDPAEAVDLARVLDASANRAQEGLRVCEDYIRFVLDDPMLTKRIKDVRHRLGSAIRGMDEQMLISARDTIGDVGAHVMTVSGKTRANDREVLAANFKRSEEALRSLEEYTKLVDLWLSGRFEVLRYDTYVLEKLTLEAVRSRRKIADARLYFLVGGTPTLGDLTWLVGEALEGGAQVIQLREKHLPDREVLSRAREVRILSAKANARFIMNDRPDLARLAGADGVHLGQDEVRIRDARRIVGPQRGYWRINAHAGTDREGHFGRRLLPGRGTRVFQQDERFRRPGGRVAGPRGGGSHHPALVRHRRNRRGQSSIRPRGRGDADRRLERHRRRGTAQGGGQTAPLVARPRLRRTHMKTIATNVHILKQFPTHAINIYLVEDVLIDAGARWAKRRIFRQLQGRKLSAHALTHAHPDHQGASKAVCEAHGIPLYCGLRDSDAMEQGRTTETLSVSPWAKRFVDKHFAGPGHPVSKRLVEGDEVAGFKVLETPGHTVGHVSYWRESDRVLIIGDVVSNIHLNTGMPGLSEPLAAFSADPAENRRSARRLAELEPAIVCFGHGAPLRDTKKFTDFIRRLPE